MTKNLPAATMVVLLSPYATWQAKRGVAVDSLQYSGNLTDTRVP